jgi:hypothetical protein
VRLVLFDEKTGGLALVVHGIGDGHRALVADDAHPQTCAAAADPARATRSSLDVKWAWKAPLADHHDGRTPAQAGRH